MSYERVTQYIGSKWCRTRGTTRHEHKRRGSLIKKEQVMVAGRERNFWRQGVSRVMRGIKNG